MASLVFQPLRVEHMFRVMARKTQPAAEGVFNAIQPPPAVSARSCARKSKGVTPPEPWPRRKKLRPMSIISVSTAVKWPNITTCKALHLLARW